uniref:Uncharacterized protein n=1 Tax=Acrobeloides nanus TaxID=290746 RepID=A0A914D866_9BILA
MRPLPSHYFVYTIGSGSSVELGVVFLVRDRALGTESNALLGISGRAKFLDALHGYLKTEYGADMGQRDE